MTTNQTTLSTFRHSNHVAAGPVILESPRWEVMNLIEPVLEQPYTPPYCAYQRSRFESCCNFCSRGSVYHNELSPYTVNSSTTTTLDECKSEVYLDDTIVDSIISKCIDSDDAMSQQASKQVTLDTSEVFPSHRLQSNTDVHDYRNSTFQDLLSPTSNTDTSPCLMDLNQNNGHKYSDLNLETELYHSNSILENHNAIPSREITKQSQEYHEVFEGRVQKKTKRARAKARAWTAEEQTLFEESLELYGRNWEQCAAHIGTRALSLVRSHAQKHLIKLWKLGKPLPKKVAESGAGYTLSGKPLLPESASAKSYLIKLPCPIRVLGDQTTP